MACTLLLPITNRHVTALRFDLMARILLLHEHEHGSWYLTTVLPTCTYCPTYRQDLALIRLRNDPNSPSCQYAYDPVACIVLLPRPVNKPRADTPTSRTRLGRASLPRPPNQSLALYYCLNPSLAPYCYHIN